MFTWKDQSESEDSDDAERRGAQIKRTDLDAFVKVKIPMMPKGVEHKERLKRYAMMPLVKIPMMPKGVEHSNEATAVNHFQDVKIPMMPKGVEHFVKHYSSFYAK